MKLNLLWSILGVIFNTIVPIVVFPYVSRVLGVDAMGKYNFYTSYFSYILLFATFGISTIGIREIGYVSDNIAKRSKVLWNLVSLNWITTITSALLSLMILLSDAYVGDLKIILVLTITLFAQAVGADFFFVAIEKQGYLLVRNIIFKIISVALIFLFVKGPSDLFIYICITVFSTSTVSVVNIYYLSRWNKLPVWKELQPFPFVKKLIGGFSVETAWRYLGLGDVVVLGLLTSDLIVGYYGMALKIYLLVTNLVKVMATALMPRASKYISQNNELAFNHLNTQSIRLIMLICVPAIWFCFRYASEIVLLLGGDSFLPSTFPLQVFSFAIIINTLSNAIIYQILFPKGKIKSILIALLWGIVSNVLLLLNVKFFNQLKVSSVAFIISNIVILFVLWFYNKDDLRSYIKFSIYKPYLVAIIPTAIIELLVPDMYFLIDAIIYGCLYGIILLWTKEEVTTSIISLLTKKVTK